MATKSCLCVYPPCVYITDRSLSHTRTYVQAHTHKLKDVCANSWGNSQLFVVRIIITTNNEKCLTSKKEIIMYLKS